MCKPSGDGVITSGTTTTLSAVDSPGHDDFILINNSPNDWRSPQNDNLWQGVNGVNNPCPNGYRLPTGTELNNERISWVQPPINSTSDLAGAFASPLKLPTPGYRIYGNGSISSVNILGLYWTSSPNASNSFHLFFNNSSSSVIASARGYGLSARCIKD